MVRNLLTALLVGALSTGCYIYDHDDGDHGESDNGIHAYPGNVTLSWSFAGMDCGDVPDIQSVVVQIPGEYLDNDGVYPCSVNGYPGIELHDFAPGSYSFTVDAWSYSNERLFAGSGTFFVDGDLRVSIDLTPVGAPTSYAYLAWRFPSGPNGSDPGCYAAGVTSVDVRIDGGPVSRYPCSAGMSMPGAQTMYLDPGVHRIDITAVDASGYAVYRFRGNLETFSGSPISAEYNLQWAVGGVSVKWQLIDGASVKSCSQAGVQNVTVNFQDSAGRMVYGSAGDSQACDSAPILYNFLAPGTYKVFLSGTGAGADYLSNAQAPQVVTVNEGVFPSEAQAVAVAMYRAN
jgi:hypothetical protein